jgi:hypothetical protein
MNQIAPQDTGQGDLPQKPFKVRLPESGGEPDPVSVFQPGKRVPRISGKKSNAGGYSRKIQRLGQKFIIRGQGRGSIHRRPRYTGRGNRRFRDGTFRQPG